VTNHVNPSLINRLSVAPSQIFMLLYIALLSVLFFRGQVVSGDSAIYIVFIRDFLKAPFAFGGGEYVSHGATSPLWVILNSLPFKVLGLEAWLVYASVLNTLFLVATVLLLSAGKEKGLSLYRAFAIGALLLTSPHVVLASAQLTEAPLAMFLISLALLLLRRGRNFAALLVGGFTILVRPELILWVISLHVLVMILGDSRDKSVSKAAISAMVSFLPSIVVYSYLGLNTGMWIPTSISGRQFRSTEDHLDWFDRLILSFGDLGASNPALSLSLLILLGLPIYKVIKNAPKFQIQAINNYSTIVALSAWPLMALWLISPPLQYTGRYTLPLLVMCGAVLASWLQDLPVEAPLVRSLTITIAGYFMLQAVVAFQSHLDPPHVSGSDWRWILGEELSGVQEVLGWQPADTVLMYEIQAQFSTSAQLISADGIVGRGEIFPFLKGEQSLSRFIYENKVNYVATMNAFEYRAGLARTQLLEIYKHDLTSEVGSILVIEGVTLRKVATQSCFSDPKCYSLSSSGQRVHGVHGPDGNRKGTAFLWNSIYEVESLTP